MRKLLCSFLLGLALLSSESNSADIAEISLRKLSDPFGDPIAELPLGESPVILVRFNHPDTWTFWGVPPLYWKTNETIADYFIFSLLHLPTGDNHPILAGPSRWAWANGVEPQFENRINMSEALSFASLDMASEPSTQFLWSEVAKPGQWRFGMYPYTSPNQPYYFEFEVSAVPEPSAWIQVALGFLATMVFGKLSSKRREATEPCVVSSGEGALA
jgi:hypothetical protein